MPPDIPWTPRLQAAAEQLGASLNGAQPLAGDGSDRRFFRLPGSPTVVLLHHPKAPGLGVNENDSYFHLGRHLRAQGAPVPEIYHYCREEGWLLLEDLGDLHLESALEREGREDQKRGPLPAGPGDPGKPATARQGRLRSGLVFRHPGGAPAFFMGAGVRLFRPGFFAGLFGAEGGGGGSGPGF